MNNSAGDSIIHKDGDTNLKCFLAVNHSDISSSEVEETFSPSNQSTIVTSEQEFGNKNFPNSLLGDADEYTKEVSNSSSVTQREKNYQDNSTINSDDQIRIRENVEKINVKTDKMCHDAQVPIDICKSEGKSLEHARDTWDNSELVKADDSRNDALNSTLDSEDQIKDCVQDTSVGVVLAKCDERANGASNSTHGSGEPVENCKNEEEAVALIRETSEDQIKVCRDEQNIEKPVRDILDSIEVGESDKTLRDALNDTENQFENFRKTKDATRDISNNIEALKSNGTLSDASNSTCDSNVQLNIFKIGEETNESIRDTSDYNEATKLEDTCNLSNSMPIENQIRSDNKNKEPILDMLENEDTVKSDDGRNVSNSTPDFKNQIKLYEKTEEPMLIMTDNQATEKSDDSLPSYSTSNFDDRIQMCDKTKESVRDTSDNSETLKPAEYLEINVRDTSDTSKELKSDEMRNDVLNSMRSQEGGEKMKETIQNTTDSCEGVKSNDMDLNVLNSEDQSVIRNNGKENPETVLDTSETSEEIKSNDARNDSLSEVSDEDSPKSSEIDDDLIICEKESVVIELSSNDEDALEKSHYSPRRNHISKRTSFPDPCDISHDDSNGNESKNKQTKRGKSNRDPRHSLKPWWLESHEEHHKLLTRLFHNAKCYLVLFDMLADQLMARQSGQWCPTDHACKILNYEFDKCDNVFLIFARNDISSYSGIARMRNKCELSPYLYTPCAQNSCCIDWISRKEIVHKFMASRLDLNLLAYSAWTNHWQRYPAKILEIEDERVWQSFIAGYPREDVIDLREIDSRCEKDRKYSEALECANSLRKSSAYYKSERLSRSNSREDCKRKQYHKERRRKRPRRSSPREEEIDRKRRSSTKGNNSDDEEDWYLKKIKDMMKKDELDKNDSFNIAASSNNEFYHSRSVANSNITTNPCLGDDDVICISDSPHRESS